MVRLALIAFEWLPFPWRFSRMSAESRSEYMEKMERSRFWLYRDLVLLAKLLTMMAWARDERVHEATGFESRCAVREGTPKPASTDLGDLEPRGDGEDCDIAIVGSGAGGAAAASILAGAGLDVMVLESGPYVDRDSYPTDPLEGLPLLYRDGGMTIAGGKPAIPVPVGRTVGGTTVINSGTCFRAPREVLAEWSEREGVGWATELDPLYAAAEEVLAVTPVDPERMGRNGQLCMEGARALGASGGPISRNAGQCVQCSSCPLGCRLDAKRASHVSYLPRALGRGARIRAGVQVQRVLTETGRVIGLACRAGLPTTASQEAKALRTAATKTTAGYTAPGRDWQVRTRTVISAGGAFGTPELLMRSGINHPALGRNLHIHPAAWIGARYEEEVRGWEGVMQSYYVDQWANEGILLEATFTPLSFGAQWLPGVGAAFSDRVANYDRIASIGVHLHDRSSGRVGLASNGSLRLSYKLLEDEARRDPVRDRARRGDPFRRRSAGGLPERRAGFGDRTRAAARVRVDEARAGGSATRGIPPDEHRQDGDGPGHHRLRSRRRGAGNGGPVRRGRLPPPHLGRGEPDDDDHRLLGPRRSRPRVQAAGLALGGRAHSCIAR